MNYRILFNDQKSKDINEEEYCLFLKSVSSRFVKIGNDIINYSNVARVEPIKNSESEYPKLPEPVMTTWTKGKKVRALKSMREGFLRGVSDANNLTANQSSMLDNMDKLILKAESILTNQQPITSFKEVFGGV